MAKQNGPLIKEKRTAAGMSQEALAKASGVSATAISKAEREIKELSPEQLEAVAKALDVTPESLLVDESIAVTDEEKELLKLFRSADGDTQKAATAALKGEAPQNQNPMAAMMSMFGGMMGGNGEGGDNPMAAMMGGNGEGGDNPMASMMSMFGGAQGGEGNGNPMASMMGMFGGMMGGAENKTAEPSEGQNSEASEEAPEEAPKSEE